MGRAQYTLRGVLYGENWPRTFSESDDLAWLIKQGEIASACESVWITDDASEPFEDVVWRRD